MNWDNHKHTFVFKRQYYWNGQNPVLSTEKSTWVWTFRWTSSALVKITFTSNPIISQFLLSHWQMANHLSPINGDCEAVERICAIQPIGCGKSKVCIKVLLTERYEIWANFFQEMFTIIIALTTFSQWDRKRTSCAFPNGPPTCVFYNIEYYGISKYIQNCFRLFQSFE